MVSDNLLDSTTVAAITCTALYMVTFFSTFFNHKFNRQSTFIISLLIYLSFSAVALSVWLAERWGFIGPEATDMVRMFTRVLVIFGAALGLRYLWTVSREGKANYAWIVAILLIFIFSSLFYFYPVEVIHVK